MFKKETEEVWLRKQVEVVLRDESKPSMKHRGTKTPLLHSVLAHFDLLLSWGYHPNQVLTVVKRLVKRKVEPNALDGRKRTTVMLAASSGQVPVYATLAAQDGLNWTLVDSEGRNVLHHASVCPHRSVIGDLRRRLSEEDYAALATAKDSQGQTPLDLATAAGASADLVAQMAKAQTKAQLSLHPDLARFPPQHSSASTASTAISNGSITPSPTPKVTVGGGQEAWKAAAVGTGRPAAGGRAALGTDKHPFVVGKGVNRARKRFLNVLGVFHDKK